MIATRLVKELLEKGYTVRGTVRDPNNQAKTEALRNLAAALPGRLELYEVTVAIIALVGRPVVYRGEDVLVELCEGLKVRDFCALLPEQIPLRAFHKLCWVLQTCAGSSTLMRWADLRKVDL